MALVADHKQIYGAGFHAGQKAAGRVTRGSGEAWRTAKDVMLAWNPGTAEVALIRWPESKDQGKKYLSTALACYDSVRSATFEQRKAIVFIEAVHLIVRDKCDPAAVHRALLGLQEYRDGCSDDMPGL